MNKKNDQQKTMKKNVNRLSTSDLIFGDLYNDKLQMQKEILNINSILNTKVEVMIIDCTHHSIFVFKEEIEELLKRRLKKARKKFEYTNLKIMQIELNNKENTHQKKPSSSECTGSK